MISTASTTASEGAKSILVGTALQGVEIRHQGVPRWQCDGSRRGILPRRCSSSHPAAGAAAGGGRRGGRPGALPHCLAPHSAAGRPDGTGSLFVICSTALSLDVQPCSPEIVRLWKRGLPRCSSCCSTSPPGWQPGRRSRRTAPRKRRRRYSTQPLLDWQRLQRQRQRQQRRGRSAVGAPCGMYSSRRGSRRNSRCSGRVVAMQRPPQQSCAVTGTGRAAALGSTASQPYNSVWTYIGRTGLLVALSLSRSTCMSRIHLVAHDKAELAFV